jgi:acyl-CoA thioesterase-1
LKLVCIGDSLTHGYKISRNNSWPLMVAVMRNTEVINKGILGDTTQGVLSRFYRDVVEERASQVVITAGTNDFINEVPLNVVKSNMATLVYHSYHYSVRPVIGVPVPVCTDMARVYWPFVNNLNEVNNKIREYREWIFEFSTNFKCQVIDFYKLFFNFESNMVLAEYYTDGLHPTLEGNRIMAQAASEAL